MRLVQQDITLRVTYDSDNFCPPNYWSWENLMNSMPTVSWIEVLAFSPVIIKDDPHAPEGTESPRQGLLDLN